MKKIFTLITFLLESSLMLNAQNLKLVQFSSGYSSPVCIENCGDSHLFIVEQRGKIFVCDSLGKKFVQPFLDITDRVLFGGERGLLGLAFDPDFKANRFFYVYYINKSGNTQVSRFKTILGKLQGNKATEKKILKINQPFPNHKGGCIRFGTDGYLYIGTGDGGSAGDPNNNAQNPMSLLGKMLRIDVHTTASYQIPSDNPFVDSPNYRHEIWALGLRNPWRWSFDAVTHAIYIADVGQNLWEEVDIQQNGVGGNNYGWRCYEANHAFKLAGCQAKAQYVFPVYEYSHSSGDCSITGGFVYRGNKYSSLYGKYIFTDYCTGMFRILTNTGGTYTVTTALDGDDGAYAAFGVDKNNEIYVTNLNDGNIYHVTVATSLQDDLLAGKNIEQNNLRFFPNPSSGNINMSYTSAKAEGVNVYITNLLGEKVFSTSKIVNAGNNAWNMNVHLSPGSYYLSIVTNTGYVITKSLRIE